jgi:hypothetical protein
VTSAKAPGVETQITADVKGDQHATALLIEMKHLPPPASIDKASTVFVVWQRKGTDSQWTRIASLNYNESDREGKLENSSVPETSFDLMITAEEKADGAAPSANVIVSQRVN